MTSKTDHRLGVIDVLQWIMWYEQARVNGNVLDAGVKNVLACACGLHNINVTSQRYSPAAPCGIGGHSIQSHYITGEMQMMMLEIISFPNI
jgi:hypothetical protein|mmetsp:Transcript_87597/g.145554  ORF Transcript_87597/g.145554 Transcript_87597/m.145554 type:complete len:91 (-) Transcript_87597:1055-1327(-)